MDDEHEEEEPRFSIISTSTKLLARVGNEMTQDDAAYRQNNLLSIFHFDFILSFIIRMNWQGYPFFVLGRS